MKPAAPKWATEADMLMAFMAEAKACGFATHAECCGHDLILVASDSTPDLMRQRHYVHSDIEPGDYVAVEGKLQRTVTVLRQATPPHRRRWESTTATAADFYAVVVPVRESDFEDVARAMDIHVISIAPAIPDAYRPHPKLNGFAFTNAHRCIGYARPKLPGLDVGLVPGVPSPRSLTPWKIAAVELCLLTRDITAADFRNNPVSPRSFLDRGWLERISGRGDTAVYRLLADDRRPDVVYPEIVAALRERGA